jgi:hypothetical protein
VRRLIRRSGRDLGAQHGSPAALAAHLDQLVDSRTVSEGVAIMVYEPAHG